MILPHAFIVPLLLSISFLAPIGTVALCTGNPSGCCGGTMYACEAIAGCNWNPSTPGNTYFGKCEGDPEPCSTFSDDGLACLKQDGCTYGPNQEWSSTGTFCTGNPKSPAHCLGVAPTSCEGGEKSVCEGVLGCTWESDPDWGTWWGNCSGTPIPCADLSNDECGCIQQAGCTFYKDPPDNEENFYDAIMPVREDVECYGPDDMYVEVSPNEFVWTNSVVMCEKCRPTSLGSDVCYWVYSVWDPSLVFHSCIMKIGDQYCSCETCEEGGTTFNCKEALESNDNWDGNTSVVGRSCSGICIWSNDPSPETSSLAPITTQPTTPEPTTNPTPTTPEPTNEEPTTVVPTTIDPTTPGPTNPTPTTLELTTEEPSTTVPIQEVTTEIVSSFSLTEHLALLPIMLIWIGLICIVI